MKGKETLPPRLKCQRCGYEWWPRFASGPRICPRCKSPYWDKPRAKEKGLAILYYVDKYEDDAETKLRQDFPKELNILEQGLDVLYKCIVLYVLGKPTLVKEIATTDYRKLKPGRMGFYACWILLGEAYTRLLAARVLFLHGYPSRALASTRDALETAMTADVCRRNDTLAMKWIKGKQIRLTDKLNYSPILKWQIWQHVQATTNPLGTHSYADAAFLSSVLSQAVRFPNADEHQQRYVNDTRFALWRMLGRCFQILTYIKITYPDAKRQVSEFDDVLALVLSTTESELQLSLDEQLIIEELRNRDNLPK